MSDGPSVPRDLAARGRGRKLWRTVLADYELTAVELEVLAELCRALDRLDELRAVATPVVVETKAGPRLNPAVVELRLLAMEVRRSAGALGLPHLDDDEAAVPSSAPNVVDHLAHQRARRAAEVRHSAGAPPGRSRRNEGRR